MGQPRRSGRPGQDAVPARGSQFRSVGTGADEESAARPSHVSSTLHTPRVHFTRSGTLPRGWLLAAPSHDGHWEHQRRLPGELSVTDVAAALAELPGVLEKVARDVEESKARDDRRGERVLDDYVEAHSPASEDEWVRQTWPETRQLQAEVRELLLRGPNHPGSAVSGQAVSFLGPPLARPGCPLQEVDC